MIKKLRLIFVAASLAVCSFSISEELNGRELAKKYCSECHQNDGNSKDDNIPKIAGFSAALTYDILDQFRNGYRDAKEVKTKEGQLTDMVKISKKLKEDEIEALSFHFADQSFKPEKQTFNKALVATGKQLHLDLCNDCHVNLATSSDDDAPILVGQWKAYLTKQFDHFSNHKRKMPKRMKKKFRKLNDDDKLALIEFYVSAKEKKETSQ
jgi:cytochrome c553